MKAYDQTIQFPPIHQQYNGTMATKTIQAIIADLEKSPQRHFDGTYEQRRLKDLRGELRLRGIKP